MDPSGERSPRPEELAAAAHSRAASALQSRLYSSRSSAPPLRAAKPRSERPQASAARAPIRASKGLTPRGMRPHPPTSGTSQTHRPAFPLRKRLQPRSNAELGHPQSLHRTAPVPPLAVPQERLIVRASAPRERMTSMSLLQNADQFRTFTERLADDPAYEQHMTHPAAFLYLRSVDNNAYNLRIVNNKEIDPADYYTLSSAGITRFTEGDSDFTSIQQFEREFYLYSMITQLPFFRSYRMWKSFREWKKAVRTRKVEERKARLEDQLFVLHPLLRTSLLQLRQLCYKAATFKLYHIDAESTFELEVFCEQQAIQKREVERKLARFADQVRALVAEACDRALRTFLKENGFTAHTAHGEHDASHDDAGGLLAAIQSGLSDTELGFEASSSQLRGGAGGGLGGRAITFTERAAMRTQCRKLTKYIRLADFFVVDTFLSLALSSTETFLKHISGRHQPQHGIPALQSPGGVGKDGGGDDGGLDGGTGTGGEVGRRSSLSKRHLGGGGAVSALHSLPSVPLFLVAMEVRALEVHSLSFSPTYDDFKMRMDMVLFDGLKVLFAPERLLTHPAFELYVQPSIDEHGLLGDGVDLEMMIVEDKHFQSVVEDINDCLENAFDRAADFSAVFTPFMEQYVTNEKLNATLNIQAYENAEIHTFNELLTKYTAQQQSFESMPTVSDVGIIRINSEGLKGLFVPSPKRCLDEIHALIPMIMRKKNDVLLHEMSTKNEAISKVPYSVDEFVDLMSFLAETNATIEALEARYDFVTELLNLCYEFRIPLSEEDNTNGFMLKETNKALHMSMQLSEDSIEDNTARFAKELDESIPKLHARVNDARTELGHAMIFSPESESAEVLAYLAKLKETLDGLTENAERNARYQTILQVAVSTYDDLDEVKADWALKHKLWNALDTWTKRTEGWQRTPFAEIRADRIDKEVEGYYKVAVIAERGLPGNLVAPLLKEKVLEFKSTLPVVVALGCKQLKPRHWDTIHTTVGYEVHGIEGFTLGQLIERKALAHRAALESVATEAVQEAVLEEMLSKVTHVWATAEFELLPYKETKDFIIGGVDDLMADLDDSLVTINTILGSRYVDPIRASVDEWQRKLVLFQETLDEWLQCQRNWMYLETIFSAPDIQRQLPAESKSFFQVDGVWKDNMKRTVDDPNALKCCTRGGLRDQFQKSNASLEKIQKSLEDYLETKRAAFPRFYFLSNDELLEILAQTKDPQAVQPHLRKCFDALVKLDFGSKEKSVDILAMMSPEGERIEMGKNLKARGNVEDWLTAVERDMKISLQKLMKAAVFDYEEKARKVWVRSHAGQVVATVAQIAWVSGTERALRSDDPVGEMGKWYDENVLDLQDLTELVRSDLTKRERKVIVALVTTDVHARDIVERLHHDRVDSTTNFTWKQQLRYVWERDVDDCVVYQSNSRIDYAYEYEGCTSRLVITPLTDRCWMTLTGALGLKLGGSPAGPAGTGKTESSKDLAKALGIQCIVFNCSDQIDYKMMGKLFSGLAMAGCWTCLDEFNRIDIEVLSVIAQQLLVLRQGRLAGHAEVIFEGREIELKEHHVIITMNPGYAGRTELPDNLKVLFRPVAMMVPDYALIAEIMLFAEGFDAAKPLSRKMCKMYMLCSEQLSQQCHYDYGLRAVKSVLVMAGGLKRANPTLSEDVVLIRAMRDSNLPKFLANDVPLFFGILQDLFPGVEVPYTDTGELQVTIEKELVNAGFQTVETFVKKIIQLYETMNVRFGVTIVGPTGSGKTTNYEILSRAMTTLRNSRHPDPVFQVVHTRVINPKCITMGELYGEFNELTQEWTDGLASSIMRQCVADETEDRKWTVFDGPIDALWIENMNTVLDDNMTLCLANGERIKLKVQMKCLFEVQDLEVASPATVSRLGVLYMTPEELGWMPYVESWVVREFGDKLSPALRKRLLGHMHGIFSDLLKFARKRIKEPVPTVDINLAESFCALFRALFSELNHIPFAMVNATTAEEAADPEHPATQLVDKLFAFATIWSAGGSIDPDARPAFSEAASAAFDKAGLHLGLSMAASVFDFYIDTSSELVVKAGGSFRPWDEIVPSFSYSHATPFFEMMVPTIDTVRYSFMCKWLLTIMKPCFFTGVTGTGKTVILQNVLRSLGGRPGDAGNDPDAGKERRSSTASLDDFDEDEIDEAAGASPGTRRGSSGGFGRAELSDLQGVVPVEVGFSAQTSAKVTQLTIEGKLEKKRKTLLGAPAGRKVVIFVDDVNMPAVEEYGAQPPIELLRQLVDFNGFYDRQKLFWKSVQDSCLVIAAAPPGGGRNPLTPRFVRHFNVFCLPPADKTAMQLIFSSIIDGFASPFVSEVRSLCKAVVESTIEIYTRISAELLPTPAKSHYTFNLRDLSKVFQGMLMVTPPKCGTGEIFTRLWMHESMRVFHDRLTCVEDKRWFTEMLTELVNKSFGVGPVTHAELFEIKPIIFGDFFRPGLARLDRVYEEARDVAKTTKLLEDYLEEYNLSNPTQMNLVFFTDAMEHVSRVSRIIRQPRGNAMLVGVGGSGKQSLTRLATSMADMECVQIEITRGYGVFDFREDLKALMTKSGVEGKQVGFLFTDTQIIDEGFLEDINNVLNSGEVPNLWQQDEMDRIVGDMRPQLKAEGIPDSYENCRLEFVRRLRDNLHVVLAMSPVGESLRVRCRQFPSLINCTTIDWYLPWPKTALLSVASRFLAGVNLPSEEVRAALAQYVFKCPQRSRRPSRDPCPLNSRRCCVEVHASIEDAAVTFYEELRRKTYTTPKSYLDLIQLYISMLAEKRHALELNKERLSTGVVKLSDTNAMVAGLKKDLDTLLPVLKVKSAETDELLVRVAHEQEEASKVEAKVSIEEAEVNKQAATVAEVQADAQRDLDKAMPALENAVKALDSLNKSDISEMKQFKSPPPAVQSVMEAVCILLGEKPDWDTSKKVMGDTHFMKNLKNYDKDNIPSSVLKKVKKYTSSEEFTVEKVSKVSHAATSLCMWVHAMDVYSIVAKEVGPKRERLEKMNQALEEANRVLGEKQAALKEVVDKVAVLQRTCDETLAEKNRLALEAEQTKARLVRAEKLTNGLASEGVRWKDTVETVSTKIEHLVGDIFLSAAAVSYLGPFTGSYRETLAAGWVGSVKEKAIPCSVAPTLVNTLGDPVQVREWQICGLPTDEVSTDNAILVTRGKRWPLMIDPQMQANRWIKQKEARSGLECIKITNPNLLRSLENTIRVGRALLIEDIEETLDPALEPVLARAVYQQGGRTLIHLGDSDIDYDASFRLYLTTKLPNPHYLPEVCIKVTVINFTVTMDGLTDQLLGTVVSKERPDIEERKARLLMSMAADKKQLQDIEDKILKLLSESTGDILDDEELINTLADSKTTSAIIKERVQESEKTNKEINSMRESYRPVALRGSIIYFVIADLAIIDPMYQYSLEYFVKLFVRCIQDSEKPPDPKAPGAFQQRLDAVLEYQTLFVFRNVCRGLFEAHKLLFAFLICAQILRNRGDVASVEWNLLLRAPSVPDHSSQPPNPDPNLVSKSSWDLLYAVAARVAGLEGLCEEISSNWQAGGWAQWAQCAQPEEAPLPEHWSERFTAFQRLLLVKAFREEKLVFAIRNYVRDELGVAFVTSASTSMEEIHDDMDCTTPCIFVLSQGADPTSILLRFAERRGYRDRLNVISLGQGQGPKAEALIRDASKSGDWVLLQNCHLARSWMPRLESTMVDLADASNSLSTIHVDFRLFLTSFPASYFPVSVLQNGVKLTNEPPKGLKANIFRSYETVLADGTVESCVSKPAEFKKLLFGLCFFHGVIQERRKFGPLGWNIKYGFDDSDLETSVEQLRIFLEEQDVVPWDALQYVTGQINYGGRVTDDWDRRCLVAILNQFYVPSILDDEYRFSESGTYFAPSATDLSGYKAYIEGLPPHEDPEIFGMHANANITFQRNESLELLHTVLGIQPRASGSASGVTPDQEVMALLSEIQAGLPANMDKEEEAGEDTFVVKSNGLLDSLATFLSQELVKFNRLLTTMRSTMAQLLKAIQGFIVMSADLDKMYTYTLNNAVPHLWSAVAYPSLKPLASWVKDLTFRVGFMRGWLRGGQPGVFPIPVFFFPQGFMTGTLQVHARKYQIAINSLRFNFTVYDEDADAIVSAPENGVVCSGLWMEGARWSPEKHEIEDSHPGETYAEMKPIHFLPTEISVPMGATESPPGSYTCPVYKTSTRAGTLSTTGLSTNFVVGVQLPTSRDAKYWVWKGVAFLCNLDD